MDLIDGPVNAVISLHGVPRYGHGNDIAVLVTNEFDSSIDYYMGLSFIVTIFGIILFAWLGILIILGFLDWRVGCASGRAFQMRSPEDLEPVAQRIVKTRISFLFFGLFLIGSSLSLMFNFSRIVKAADVVNSRSKDYVSAIQSPILHSEEVLNILDDSAGEREFFLSYLDAFCPVAMKDEKLRDASLSIEDALISLDDFYQSEIRDLISGLNTSQDFFRDVVIEKTSKKNVRPWQSQMLALYICVVLMVFVLISGVVLAGMPNDSPHYVKFTQVQTWFLYPIFFLTVLVSWAGTAGIVIVAIMTSDFCYGGGDIPGGAPQTISNMVQQMESKGNSNIAYESMSYIASGCSTQNPLSFLNEYENKIQRAKTSNIKYISVVTQPNYSEMGIECVNGEQDILDSAVILGTNLDRVMERIKELKMTLNCGVLYPIWVQGIEEAVCREGINALAWTFYSFVVVSFCSLSLYSLRAARNDVEVTFSEKDDEFEEAWKHDGRRTMTPRSISGRVSPFDTEMNGKSKREGTYFSEDLRLEDDNEFRY